MKIIEVEFKNCSPKDVKAIVDAYVAAGTYSVANIVAVPTGGFLFLLAAP